MNLFRSTLLLAAVAITAACDEPTGPGSTVEPATIGGVDEPSVTLSLDDGVLVAHIVTYGNPCTERHHDEIDADRPARLVTVRPFNQVSGGLCFASLDRIPHTVRIPVDESGEWTVLVIGRGMPISVGTEGTRYEPLIVEKRITIELDAEFL